MNIDTENLELKQVINQKDKINIKDINSHQIVMGQQQQKKSFRQSKFFKKFVQNDEDEIHFKLNDSIEKFQLRGEGVFFYFYFLKFFIKVFFIIGLISLASIIVNAKGDGMKSQSGMQILLKTTIGNQKKIRITKKEMRQLKKMEPEERNLFIREKNKDVLIYQKVHMYIDIAINLVFFLSIFIFQYKVNKKSQEIEQVYQSIKNYTILVKGIKGKDQQTEDIKKYFEKFGQIEQIDYAYAYNDSLNDLVQVQKNYQKILDIDQKNLKQEKKMKQYKKFLKIIKKYIQNILQKNKQKFFDFKAFSNFNIQYVFVTFKLNKLPYKIKSQFQKAYHKPFIQRLTCKNFEPSKSYQYKDQKLEISLPDHPQNIIWENVEFNNRYRKKRKILLILVSIGLITISFISNLLLTALTEDENEVQCSSQEISLEEAQSSEKPFRQKIINCFCEQYSIINFIQNKNSDEYQLCEKFYQKKIEEFIINIGIGLLITITNLIIETLIIKFTLLIKFEQITKLISKQVVYTFIVEYINTAFIIMFIYSEFNGFSLIRYLNNLINSEVIRIHKFIDSFNRRWYNKIGSNLITPLFISIFSPHVFILIIVAFKRCFFKKINRKNKLQKQNFEIGSNLKEALKLIVICYTFSSGIPIYYHFVYAGLFLIYWTQKYLFVYNSKVPPPLGKKFMQSIYPLMKLTLIVHMIFSIVFYSNEEIFPTKVTINLDNEQSPDQISNYYDIIEMIERTFPIVIQLCLFLIILLLELIFHKPFHFISNCLFKKRKLTKIESLELNIKTKEMKKNKNSRYHIMLNPQYKKIFKFQDEKLQRIQEIIEQSTMKDLMNFDSQIQQIDPKEQFRKIVSIEIDNQTKKNDNINQQLMNKIIIIFIVLQITLNKSKNLQFIQDIKRFIESKNYNENILNKIVTNGNFNGQYFLVEFIDILPEIHFIYPQFLTDFISIGQTYHLRKIYAIKMGKLGIIKRKQNKKTNCFNDILT